MQRINPGNRRGEIAQHSQILLPNMNLKIEQICLGGNMAEECKQKGQSLAIGS